MLTLNPVILLCLAFSRAHSKNVGIQYLLLGLLQLSLRTINRLVGGLITTL